MATATNSSVRNVNQKISTNNFLPGTLLKTFFGAKILAGVARVGGRAIDYQTRMTKKILIVQKIAAADDVRFDYKI